MPQRSAQNAPQPFCPHPMLVSDKLGEMGLMEHTPRTTEPYASFQAAKRYCIRKRLAGFGCRREGHDDIVVYEYVDARDTDIGAKLVKAFRDNRLTSEDINRYRVFYQRSASPCRASVADRVNAAA